MSKHLSTPFRFDYVGSFLRPARLKEARQKFAEQAISGAELKAVENDCIRELVAKQKAAGYHVITDGEFRRATWHLDFMWGFQGVAHQKTDKGVCFHGEPALIDDTWITGPLSAENHPFVEHFKFVHALEDENTVAKLTIPAPAQFFQQMILPDNIERTRKVYATDEALIEAIAAGYRTVIRDLYEAGCRNLQFDDCTWGMIVDDDFWKSMAGTGFTLESEAGKYLRVNNLALEGRPADLVVTTHVCRGNYHSTYATRGSYDPVAPWLFAHENVDAFYLEYDDERSGSFEPLAFIPADKKVVLGLVTTKSPVLEDRQAVIARIREAERYVPLERLYLSPQCGFASCEIGNKLTEDDQWAKLRLVQDIAHQVWG